MATHYVPPGFQTVTPYLIVAGAPRLIEFLKSAFDAEEVMRMDHPEGGIAHAAVRIGGSMIEISDATDDWPAMPGSIHLYVPDIDAAYRRAVEAGAETLREPEDMFYGERGASVCDPVGNYWHIATVTEELSVEEMHRRAAELGHGKPNA